MDLAKIRQKARQDRDLSDSENSSPEPVSKSGTDSSATDSIQTPGAPGDIFTVDDITLQPSSHHIPGHMQPVSWPSVYNREENIRSIPSPVRDPLAVILAGRAAAGCDEDQPLASSEIEEVVTEQYLEFLCFRVSDEYYGINIMDIKEIIKPRETTEVPRSPSFVSGIISLRGTIIPIIDMLDRLGLARESLTGRERVIVVKLKDGFSGLLVDEIIQVVHIAADTLEPAPAVLDGIDRDFVTGIGRSDGKMIIVLNLDTVADINLF